MSLAVAPALVAAADAPLLGLLTGAAGLIVVAALVVLLVQREIIRAVMGHRADHWIHMVDLALIPLLLVFMLVIGARLAALLG